MRWSLLEAVLFSVMHQQQMYSSFWPAKTRFSSHTWQMRLLPEGYGRPHICPAAGKVAANGISADTEQVKGSYLRKYIMNSCISGRLSSIKTSPEKISPNTHCLVDGKSGCINDSPTYCRDIMVQNADAPLGRLAGHFPQNAWLSQ